MSSSSSSPSSSFLEIRLFYVRISSCSLPSPPPSLILSHLRRPLGVSLEVNGIKIPSSDPTSLLLRRDRIDPAEVTYVSTDGIKLAGGAVDFEVSDDKGNLVLCGSIEKMEAAWSNGSCSEKDPRTGWSMDCYLAAGASGKMGEVEVYVAGCFGGVPLILTQTVQMSPRRKGRVGPGGLGSIPEGEETGESKVVFNGRTDGLVSRRLAVPLADGESDDGYDSDTKIGNAYYPEGWHMDEDGQLSWFNAGVRVGVGIGLGMCVGLGIGVGLLMRSYQATTRSFKRRFF